MHIGTNDHKHPSSKVQTNAAVLGVFAHTSNLALKLNLKAKTHYLSYEASPVIIKGYTFLRIKYIHTRLLFKTEGKLYKQTTTHDESP